MVWSGQPIRASNRQVNFNVAWWTYPAGCKTVITVVLCASGTGTGTARRLSILSHFYSDILNRLTKVYMYNVRKCNVYNNGTAMLVQQTDHRGAAHRPSCSFSEIYLCSRIKTS